jgi:hypothetical protein
MNETSRPILLIQNQKLCKKVTDMKFISNWGPMLGFLRSTFVKSFEKIGLSAQTTATF